MLSKAFVVATEKLAFFHVQAEVLPRCDMPRLPAQTDVSGRGADWPHCSVCALCSRQPGRRAILHFTFEPGLALFFRSWKGSGFHVTGRAVDLALTQPHCL